MTEDHHADTRTESNRLRKLGTGLVTDSFGEARYDPISPTRGRATQDIFIGGWARLLTLEGQWKC